MKLFKNKSVLTLSAFVLMLCGTTSLKAEMADWTKPFVGPGQRITTLIVTGNFAKPRIIAELIQASTRQPILLTPAHGQDGIYFLPPEKDGGKAMKIPYNELTNFINFIGAKQIVVLGNSQYVSDKFFDKISDTQTVCRITSRNWQRTANTLASFLNIPNLSGDYKELAAKMTNEVNYVRADTGASQDSEMTFSESNEIQPLTSIDTANDAQPKIEPPRDDSHPAAVAPFTIDPTQK